MATAILRNGAPQPVFYGTDDQSIPALVPEPVVSPIHLPLIFTFAERGDHKNAYVVSGDSLFSMYGSNVADLDSEYTTFNTPFLELFNSQANAVMVQRVLPVDAKQATLRVYAEVYTAKVPVYQRAADNSVVYNSATGKPVQTGTTNGKAIIWRVGEIKTPNPIRQGVIYNGSITGSDGVVSKIYPIMDLPASFFGKKGSDIGFRLSCPNAKSSTPLDTTISTAIGARILTMQFVERDEDTSSPTITRTLDGAASVSFSMKPGAYYRDMRMNLDVNKVLVSAFRNMNPDSGLPPDLGPISELYIYQSNLNQILTDAHTAIGGTFGTDIHMVDIYTGLDTDGNPYNGLMVDDGSLGGEIFTEAHTHYLEGGSNGTMSNAIFDELVLTEMQAFGTGTVNYLDIAKYPCSYLWDSGFSTNTKKALCRFIGQRPDTNVVLSTHVFDKGQNDAQAENSMKVALVSYARAYPESQRYGTATCRAAVVGHSFHLNNSQYTDFVPASYSLAKMTARYAGAGIAKFNSAYRFDRGELAVIEEGYDINLTYKTPDGYSSDWEAGLINIRSFDQYRYFFPALQTVYNNDRSVLKGYLAAMVIGDLERITHTVWREMSGASSLTNAEMIKMVNEKIIEKTEGRYDGVVDIVPNAYFTAQDLSNGYSITVDINLYGQVIKTVHKYTIVAHRRADSAAA